MTNFNPPGTRQCHGKYYSAAMLNELLLLDSRHKCDVCGAYSGRKFNGGEAARLSGNPPLCQECRGWHCDIGYSDTTGQAKAEKVMRHD